MMFTYFQIAHVTQYFEAREQTKESRKITQHVVHMSR